MLIEVADKITSINEIDNVIMQMLFSNLENYTFIDYERNDNHYILMKNKTFKDVMDLFNLPLLPAKYLISDHTKQHDIITFELDDLRNSIYIKRYKSSLHKGGNKEIFFKKSYQREEYIFFIDTGSIYKNSLGKGKGFPIKSIKSLTYSNISDILFLLIIYFNKNKGVNIFKDIKREFELFNSIEHLKFLNISFDRLGKFDTKRDILKEIMKKDYIETPNNINRLTLRQGFYFLKNLKNIEEKDQIKLFDFIKSSKHTDDDIFLNYFLEKIGLEKGTNSRENIISDYIWLSLELGSKINLNIRSLKRIEQEHNKLLFEYRLVAYKGIKMQVSKKYDTLKLPSKFIRLNNSEEMIKEAIAQSHCVDTYIDRVNKGRCVIYTTTFEDKKYTIEITKQRNKFLIKQVLGKFNEEAPVELINELEASLCL